MQYTEVTYEDGHVELFTGIVFEKDENTGHGKPVRHKHVTTVGEF